MRPNNIRTIWQDGGAVINGWLSIPSGWTAEVMALQGFDSVTVDMQHGLIHYDAALPMLQGIATTPTVALARVPWNEPGIIMKMLDAGCYGLICPMINTREECERFVGACRYPPSGGYRSNGPLRASIIYGNDYVAQADTTVLTFAMIETAQAIANLDEILSVPGLDAIYVGPSDLSFSLTGVPRMEYDGFPQLFEALDVILAGCARHGIYPGIHCSGTKHAKQMIERGFKFVTLFSDNGYLVNAVSAAVGEMKGTSATGRSGPY